VFFRTESETLVKKTEAPEPVRETVMTKTVVDDE